MPPAVSVVTPTKNRLPLLRETIASVRAQSFDAWEHIIVDDGSDDGTAEAVVALAAADPRIRYIPREGERTGANVCRNIGIAASAAELIVFLDSDDVIRPDCLAHRVAVMQRNHDIDFCVFRASIFVSSPGDLARLYHPMSIGDDLLRFLSHECIWEITGPIWRRSFLQKIGGFDEALLSMQDLEMHVRALCGGGKYLRFQKIDHDIRGQVDPFRTSTRHFRESAYIDAAERTPDILLETLKRNGLLTWSRQRAVLGLCFGAAESWARSKRLARAVWAWDRSCRRQKAPQLLRLVGMFMLAGSRIAPSEGSLLSRLVNRWKGWVRFRQEPVLLDVVAESD